MTDAQQPSPYSTDSADLIRQLRQDRDTALARAALLEGQFAREDAEADAYRAGFRFALEHPDEPESAATSHGVHPENFTLRGCWTGGFRAERVARRLGADTAMMAREGVEGPSLSPVDAVIHGLCDRVAALEGELAGAPRTFSVCDPFGDGSDAQAYTEAEVAVGVRPTELERVRALAPGENYHGGGGATPEWLATPITLARALEMERGRRIKSEEEHGKTAGLIFERGKELREQRRLTWEAWEREAAADARWRDISRQFVQKSQDLHAALCDGAFKLERDPFEMQEVFTALQDGHVSTGYARTALRRWLAGLPVDRVPAEPDPESASALYAKEQERRRRMHRRAQAAEGQAAIWERRYHARLERIREAGEAANGASAQRWQAVWESKATRLVVDWLAVGVQPSILRGLIARCGDVIEGVGADERHHARRILESLLSAKSEAVSLSLTKSASVPAISFLVVLPPVYLWLDDERPAPSGWRHARTVAEAIAVLEAGPVEAASLDHDLGDVDAANAGNPGHAPRERTGYDLLLWMAEHGRWPRQKPVVHSANPVGRAAMVQFIDRHWRTPEGS